MTRCSHPDCERIAVGSEQRQTATMPSPGFYPYCAEHLPTPFLALALDRIGDTEASHDQLRDELVSRFMISDLYEACQSDSDYEMLDWVIGNAVDYAIRSAQAGWVAS